MDKVEEQNEISADAACVTGIGIISCLGLGLGPLLGACLQGRSGLAADAEFGGFSGRIPAAVLRAAEQAVASDAFTRHAFAGDRLDASPAAKLELLTAFAFMQAMQTSGNQALTDDTGIIFATTTGAMANWERDLPLYIDSEITATQFAQSFRDQHLGRCLDAVIANTGWRGPLQVLTSACAAGTQALVLAHRWIKSGKVRRCLVGGAETLTQMTMRGFGCFSLTSPEIAAPFDTDRSGINLSEAGVFLVLERQERGNAAASPNAKVGYLLGGATMLDAFDMTRPEPEGRGIYRAMQRALASANTSPAAIDWLYAHGTGTLANDAAEATAARVLFGDILENQPIVSSTKAIHGHALGASGLLETALAFAAMQHGVILPSFNTKNVAPDLRLNIAKSTVRRQPKRVLKSTLGFGGVNAAVVLGMGGVRR